MRRGLAPLATFHHRHAMRRGIKDAARRYWAFLFIVLHFLAFLLRGAAAMDSTMPGPSGASSLRPRRPSLGTIPNRYRDGFEDDEGSMPLITGASIKAASRSRAASTARASASRQRRGRESSSGDRQMASTANDRDRQTRNARDRKRRGNRSDEVRERDRAAQAVRDQARRTRDASGFTSDEVAMRDAIYAWRDQEVQTPLTDDLRKAVDFWASHDPFAAQVSKVLSTCRASRGWQPDFPLCFWGFRTDQMGNGQRLRSLHRSSSRSS